MRKILLMLLVFCGFLFSANAQQKIVSGTVTSSVEGEGVLPGVTVSVKGTTMGVTTDINGKYSLVVPDNAVTLIFSYIGMKKQEVDIGNLSVIDILMEPDVLGLNEVVVTALGISREKKSLGYSVQQIGGEGFDYGNAAMDINPDDIESISVLKGAAASALYGSRAANGVVRVTVPCT
ncbi:MAG: carboxypeptidase-like regulatory domain-containing protein [Bacteroidales bacterium]|nr:carboxypeptidase-like regulatory domain-containing protein [Bacteroidales bacterium]